MNWIDSIKEINKARTNNRLVIFVGSGVSNNSGVPTWKYIRKIRLEKARQLLSDNMNVKNTAAMTGFSDVYSFSRAYSGYFGYPPSKT